MNTKARTNKKGLVLRIFSLILFLPALSVFLWFGWMKLSKTDHAVIRGREDLMISDGKVRCMINLPEGVLTVKRPMNGAVNARSAIQAQVDFQKPLRLGDCDGPLPNWNLQLEAQTSLIGTDGDPHSIQRQPLTGRTAFSYHWKFTPEKELGTYPAHIWLRLVVLNGLMEVERWNLFYYEFPFANRSFFGIPTDLVLIFAGVLTLIGGLVFWLSFLINRKDGPETKGSDFS